MSESSEKPELKRGVVIEFDYTVLPGHKLLLDCCARRLSKEGVTLDFGLMARKLFGKSFSTGFNSLCAAQNKTLDISTIVTECQEEYVKALQSKLSKIDPVFFDFVKALLAKDLRVVIASRLEPGQLQPLFAGMESENLIFHRDRSNCFGCTARESWRRTARKIGLFERLTLAVAASGYSAKNALTSGMAIFAKPNALTEYQDFSGSDRMIDAFSTDLVEDALTVLRF